MFCSKAVVVIIVVFETRVFFALRHGGHTHTHTRNVTIHHETGQDACGLCVHKCVCAGKKNRTGTREKRIEMIHVNYDIDRDDIWNISFEL